MTKYTHMSSAIAKVNKEITEQNPSNVLIAKMEAFEKHLKSADESLKECELGQKVLDKKLASAKKLKSFYEKELERIYYLISLKNTSKPSTDNRCQSA